MSTTAQGASMHVASLYRYPIKGCRGHALDTTVLDALGFERDRRLMLVDPSGRFVSQREEPLLATLEPELDGNRLTVRVAGAKPLLIEIDPSGHEVGVSVWGQEFQAVDQGERAAEWFSDAVGSALRLVWYGPSSRRLIDPTYSPRADAATAFTDGYQVLVVQQASLDDLNARLPEPIPMERFRPNIVVRGGTAWDEDGWKELRVGTMTFDAVKPCARCLVTTTDQRTGARHPHQEPLRTLASFRTLPGFGAIFGQNLVMRAPGTLSVGDTVSAT
ncbi:MAG: MOSC N-terminal beta barrel domain-containing protein [Gemmatimonadota bacterium]